jgi:hypothetical protein
MPIAPFIHPNTPRRLRNEFEQCGYRFHKLAELREVNVALVHALIHHGKEPTDKTEKGRAARKALYLPKYRRAPKPRAQTPAWLKPIKRGIRKMTKETKQSLLCPSQRKTSHSE